MLKDARYLEGCRLLECFQLDAADQEFRSLIEEQPNHFEAINKVGVIFVQKGHPAEGKECFLQALEIEPMYAPALVNIGNLYQEDGDINLAERYYKEAIEADLDYPMTYYNLALIHKRQGNYKKYVSEMKKYKRLHRRAMPDEDEQFRLNYKRKLGCLPSMILSLIVVAIIAIGLL